MAFIIKKNRSNYLTILLVAVFGWFLGVIIDKYLEYATYERLAMQNAVYVETEYADRGSIYDRNQKEVVSNFLSYDLMTLPFEIGKDTDTAFLCSILRISTKKFKEMLRQIIVKEGYSREAVFYPYLDEKLRFALQENIWRVPGFFLKKRSLRNYLYPYGFHAFGYVGEVAPDDIAKNQDDAYTINSLIGKSGLEKYYDDRLRGKDGKRIWLRDNKNRIVSEYEGGELNVKPDGGQSLISSIDIRLQMLAEDLLANKRGAIVAIEPHTGEILCLVSSPRVDPFLMRKDQRTSYYRTLVNDENVPLLNRAIQGRYSPGSAFKVIESLLSMDRRVINTDYGYNCLGVYRDCVKPVRCEHKEPGHARNLENALSNSCNSYFINLFKLLWIDAAKKYPGEDPINVFKRELLNMGVGKKLNIDIDGEKEGFIPDSSYYTRLYGNTSWGFCTLMSLGIGQGELLMTPLQLANQMAIIANKGYYISPHMMKAFKDKKGKIVYGQFKKETVAHIDSGAYRIITNAMETVVKRGTGHSAYVSDIRICGKTGTVENYSIINKKRVKLRNNAIFTGFAPADDPQIAFVVIVENAGYGATTAAPIASLLVKQYIKDSLNNMEKRQAAELSEMNFLPLQTKSER